VPCDAAPPTSCLPPYRGEGLWWGGRRGPKVPARTPPLDPAPTQAPVPFSPSLEGGEGVASALRAGPRSKTPGPGPLSPPRPVALVTPWGSTSEEGEDADAFVLAPRLRFLLLFLSAVGDSRGSREACTPASASRTGSRPTAAPTRDICVCTPLTYVAGGHIVPPGPTRPSASAEGELWDPGTFNPGPRFSFSM